jgi:Leucine-rich repeat (LRR) protein
MYYHDKNWKATYDNYIKSLGMHPKSQKQLSFRKFGMNWGIYHYDLNQDFKDFVNLEFIDLSYNYIDVFVIDFSNFPKLKKIDASHNALYYWGQEGSLWLDKEFNAPNLEELDISDGICGYIKVHQGAKMLKTLKRLDLSGNYFTIHGGYDEERPPILQLPTFEQLEYLNLGHNHYVSVPKLSYLPTIKELDLTGNPLRANFQELLQLPKLEVLHLGGNAIKKLPKPFLKLKGLRELDLRSAQLSKQEIGQLKAALPQCKIYL